MFSPNTCAFLQTSFFDGWISEELETGAIEILLVVDQDFICLPRVLRHKSLEHVTRVL